MVVLIGFGFAPMSFLVLHIASEFPDFSYVMSRFLIRRMRTRRSLSFRLAQHHHVSSITLLRFTIERMAFTHNQHMFTFHRYAVSCVIGFAVFLCICVRQYHL